MEQRWNKQEEINQQRRCWRQQRDSTFTRQLTELGGEDETSEVRVSHGAAVYSNTLFTKTKLTDVLRDTHTLSHTH